MNYVVSIEGQSMSISEDVALDDNKIKAALSPYFPGAANAKITRSEPVNDTITVTVIKQAGTKGGDVPDSVLTRLITAKEGKNPVADLYDELTNADGTLVTTSVEDLLILDERIEHVLQEGTQETRNIDKTLTLLQGSPAQPAAAVVEGF